MTIAQFLHLKDMFNGDPNAIYRHLKEEEHQRFREEVLAEKFAKTVASATKKALDEVFQDFK